MEWVETTGRTVEEALDVALDELGVDEQDAEWEVMAEPRSGFLGRFGGSEARVRARVKPMSREKPGERRRRRGPGGGPNGRPRSGGRGGSRGGQRERKGPRREEPAGDAAAGDRPQGDRPQGDRSQAARPAGESDRTNPRRRRRRGGARPAGATNAPNEGASVSEAIEVPIEEQAAAAEEFTAGLVDAFGVGGSVASEIDGDDTVFVEVTGENLGLLVGPRGATLQAMEELVRTVVQRQTGGHGVRIHVDVAGYRAKRREALSAFARKLADQAIADGQVQVLEPMPASDRKVVHDVVAEIDGVATESEGEEPRRRVVIRPA